MFGRKKSAAADRDAAAPREPEDAGPSTDGPHERSAVPDPTAYYAELGFGHIDLGAMAIGVPKGRELNVALDPNGQPEFHVVTTVSRVIPRAFAAPRTPGQWRSMVTDMRDQLEQQNADVSIVDGPWGRELVAEMPSAVFRAIGVDGDRWTAEVRIMATPDNADAAAEEGREVFRHLLIHRGEGPMPAREQLALTIPDEIQQAMEKARAQAAAQKQAQAYQQQMSAGSGAQASAAAPQGVPAQNGSVGQGGSPEQNGGPGQGGRGGQQPTDASSRSGSAPAPPRRDGSAMDRLRGDDDL